MRTLGNEEQLDLNNNNNNTGGKSTFLNVGDEPLYVGGVPNSIKDRITKQLDHVKNATSLNGCLTSLYINSDLKDLLQVEYSHKITPGCSFKEACYASNNKCLNGATCAPVFSLNKDFTCECRAEFTGSLCENAVEKPMSYMALPLVGAAAPLNLGASKRKQSSCTESVESEYYVDAKSGCKTKRKLRIVRCQGGCSSESSGISVRDSKLNAFSSADGNTPFGFLIGTNKKQVNSRSLSGSKGLTPFKRLASQCCVASVSKPRKLKLYCEDGGVLVADVSLVKQCACSKKCENV